MKKEQIKGFLKRNNANQRKLEAGIALHKKGRPPKDHVVSEQDKVAKLKYILARKEAKIKSSEMGNGYIIYTYEAGCTVSLNNKRFV